MADRHGIERLRWLRDPDPDVAVYGVAGNYPRFQIMSTADVQIEVATALIEELHDAILTLNSPAYVINGTDSS